MVLKHVDKCVYGQRQSHGKRANHDPKDVRDALGVSNGDRVTFIVEGNTVRIVNSAVYAMQVLQQEMAGEAERAGLTSEDTVVALVKEARKKQVQHLQRGEKQ